MDLRDLYRASSHVSAVMVATLTAELPEESRTRRWLSDDPWNENEHLLLEIMNSLRGIEYWVSCNIATKTKDFKKIANGAPKPTEHPTIKPKEKPERKFVSGKDAQALIQNITKK